MNILGIPGSLRDTSSAGAVLRFVQQHMPPSVSFQIYDALETIPPFNDSHLIPPVVSNLITKITQADGVFICTPEYAFGVPGVLKNALDWTVASTAFTEKPVALITASSVGDRGHAALRDILMALGSAQSDDTCLLISFIRAKLDENGNVKDESTRLAVLAVIDHFVQRIRKHIE